ncbi:hypothetical protein EDD66_10339 [Mobilisporobacter senegalensis]|uniref:DUF3221 domain-containing protein n=1 Tax=Mobilisporobacter senegalensis TaxID=1329262 RepID=A0A3N1XR01_9FIRM|nr:hypothetical protein [Mobilisporobacter senegalensis]ROR29104.1 hypothetical protein EDD66_10339 [Mobilisporobacter senegalensis]
MKKMALIILSFIICVIVIGCSKKDADTEQNNDMEQLVFQAQIVNLSTGDNPSCLVVAKEDIGYGDNPTLISLNIPEDQLFNMDDNTIAMKDLEPGNILEITSDGAFLESYPLQIGTVYKVKIVDKGSVKDIEQYEEEVSKYVN